MGTSSLQDEAALALAFVPGGTVSRVAATCRLTRTPGTTPETGMLPEAAAAT